MNSPTPNVGDNITFTVVLTNNGPDNATGVVVQDTFPTGLTYVSSVAAPGTTYNPTTGVWTVGNLADLASVTLTITAQVVNFNTQTNVVTVSGKEIDPNLNNNHSSATETPLGPSSLSGFVYRDNDMNGVFDPPTDSGISGVTVTLNGTDNLGHVVHTVVTTNAGGFYGFNTLIPGHYTITETTPALYGPGTTNVGTQGGTANGNVITIPNLTGGVSGINNNFGHINLPPVINPIPNQSINNCLGQYLSVQVTFVDAPTDGPWTATVDYGDGSQVQTLNLGFSQSFLLQHAYAMDQTYQVTVTVHDSFGQSATTSFLVLDDTTPPAPQNQLFTINDGSAQRSMIDSLTVTFNQLVTIGAGAFTLKNSKGVSIGLRTIVENIGGQTVVLIQFTGAGIIGGSLADGSYTFTIVSSLIQLQSGGLYNGGVNQTFQFTRLFGDVNGDGKVNATDLAALNAAMRSKEGTPPYVWYLDYDQNCQIDATDYRYFLVNYRP